MVLCCRNTSGRARAVRAGPGAPRRQRGGDSSRVLLSTAFVTRHGYIIRDRYDVCGNNLVLIH